jgi:hypothetical protein
MTKLKIMAMDNEPSLWQCQVDATDYDGRANHALEIVGLTEAETTGLVSGYTYMIAVGAPIIGRTIDVTGLVDKSFDTTLADQRGDITSRTVGARKVLGVRVTSGDGANQYSRAQLIDNVFTDGVNLVERFSSCSYGQLTFAAFSGNMNGQSVQGGIYEVTISERTASKNKYEVQGFVIDKLNRDLGSNFWSQIDHLMIFMPSNVGAFAAYAEYPGKLSVYDGHGASYGSIYYLHEIGHNLYLDHSGRAGNEYADVTCSMGYAIDKDDHRVCFNPPKSWALGWYEDKHVTLEMEGGAVEEISLVGVAEYNIAGNNELFVRLVNGAGGDDYFIGFNRAVGINADQTEAKNQVTVTKSGGSEKKSFRVAEMSAGATFTISELDVVVEVRSINVSSTPGVATIKITSTGPGNEGGGGGGGGGGSEGGGSGGGGNGAGGAACFSGENIVSVLGKGDTRLDAVEIGDYVRTSLSSEQPDADASYTRVYGFLHLHRQLPTKFLQFTFRNENALQLEVSPKHLLFTKGRTIAAGRVKVGDVLDGGDEGDALIVTRIKTVERHGVYAPATESGELVVSGVRASNYVNLLDASAIDQHAMSHAFLSPVRFVCQIRFDWCRRQESYTEEGYSHWVKFFVWISDILNHYGFVTQYLTTVLVAPLVALLAAFDQVFVSGRGLVLAAGLSVAAASIGRNTLFPARKAC